MPTTINLRAGGASAGDGVKLPSTNPGQMKKLIKVIDFAETNRTATDILQLFDVPAGSYVQAVKCQVVSVEGAASTADIGDADDADGYIDGASLNAAAHNCSAPGVITEGAPNTIVPAFGRGKFYAAAGVISMIVNDDLDNAKVKVEVLIWQ